MKSFTVHPIFSTALILVSVVLLSHCDKGGGDQPPGDSNSGANVPKKKELSQLDKARLAAAEMNGKNIYLTLKNFSFGNNEQFPEGKDANEALGQLVDDLASEAPFYVRNSPWHGKKFEKGPDSRWEFSEPPGKALEAGENGWSYTNGLTPNNEEKTPILATIMDTEVGKRCVVIFANGESEIQDMEIDTYRPSELFPELKMVDPLQGPGADNG